MRTKPIVGSRPSVYTSWPHSRLPTCAARQGCGQPAVLMISPGRERRWTYGCSNCHRVPSIQRCGSDRGLSWCSRSAGLPWPGRRAEGQVPDHRRRSYLQRGLLDPGGPGEGVPPAARDPSWVWSTCPDVASAHRSVSELASRRCCAHLVYEAGKVYSRLGQQILASASTGFVCLRAAHLAGRRIHLARLRTYVWRMHVYQDRVMCPAHLAE